MDVNSTLVLAGSREAYLPRQAHYFGHGFHAELFGDPAPVKLDCMLRNVQFCGDLLVQQSPDEMTENL